MENVRLKFHSLHMEDDWYKMDSGEEYDFTPSSKQAN